MKFQKATVNDAKKIQQLIKYWARKGVLIDRSLNYVYENIRDFWIAKERNSLVAASALHVVGWDDLAEVKSLVVSPKYQGKGIGRCLVDLCVDEAAELGLKKVFALTFVSKFFKKCGFKKIKLDKLPHKIWSDCVNCAHFPNCKEEALVYIIKDKKR